MRTCAWTPLWTIPPTYRILKNRRIRVFIDLNNKRGRPKTIPDAITIDKDGTPLCQEKPRMKPNGYDKSSGCLIWRCPYGKEHCPKCRNSGINHVSCSKILSVLLSDRL